MLSFFSQLSNKNFKILNRDVNPNQGKIDTIKSSLDKKKSSHEHFKSNTNTDSNIINNICTIEKLGDVETRDIKPRVIGKSLQLSHRHIINTSVSRKNTPIFHNSPSTNTSSDLFLSNKNLTTITRTQSNITLRKRRAHSATLLDVSFSLESPSKFDTCLPDSISLKSSRHSRLFSFNKKKYLKDLFKHPIGQRLKGGFTKKSSGSLKPEIKNQNLSETEDILLDYITDLKFTNSEHSNSSSQPRNSQSNSCFLYNNDQQISCESPEETHNPSSSSSTTTLVDLNASNLDHEVAKQVYLSSLNKLVNVSKRNLFQKIHIKKTLKMSQAHYLECQQRSSYFLEPSEIDLFLGERFYNKSFLKKYPHTYRNNRAGRARCTPELADVLDSDLDYLSY